MLKKLHYCIMMSMLCIFFFSTNVYAEEKSTADFSVEIKSTDLSYRQVEADISIEANIIADEENTYLVLPINKNSNATYYLDPNSQRATVLSGYINLDGYFIVQFPAMNADAKYYLQLKSIKIPLNDTPNENSCGYYQLRLDENDAVLAPYKANLLTIRNIRLKDTNISTTNFTKKDENENTSLIEINDSSFDLVVYEKKLPVVNSPILKFVIMSFSILTMLGLLFLPNCIYWLSHLQVGYKVCFSAVIGILFILTVFYIDKHFSGNELWDTSFPSVLTFLIGSFVLLWFPFSKFNNGKP